MTVINSTSEASLLTSNDDADELSIFKRIVSQKHSFMDILRNKYVLGSGISDVLSGTDLDAYTLFQLWNTHKTSQNSLILQNQFPLSNEYYVCGEASALTRDFFVIYHQQLCYSWQSQLDLLNRDRSIYEIPPQNNVLTHIIDPKTLSLAILTYIYKLYGINFIGLQNEPNSASIPGPYLGLLRTDTREDYFTSLEVIHNSVMSKFNKAEENELGVDNYLDLSYFISELDFIYGYILVDGDCYKNYTEPLLMNMFTNWFYGKCSLLFYLYRMRKRYTGVTSVEVLNRFNIVLSLICNVLYSELKDEEAVGEDVHGDNIRYNFHLVTFISIIYSYLYAILSIPIHLLFWENISPEDYNTFNHNLHSTCIEPGKELEPSKESPLDSGNITPQNIMPILPTSFSNDFASTAADSTCVENTKRCDTLMSHAIGFLTGEGNWIKRTENFSAVIDTYKLGLAWYKRPTFSNTLCDTNNKAWSIALAWYYLIIAPCGRAWFTWCWRNHEGWGSKKIWSYLHEEVANDKTHILNIKTHLKKLTGTPKLNTTCSLCLKRMVSLRLRDTISYTNNAEFELKKATMYY